MGQDVAQRERRKELTTLQENFVGFLLYHGKSATDAARAAGFSDPEATAVQLLRMPHVLDAIERERDRALSYAASLAVGVTINLLSGRAPPGGVSVGEAVKLAHMAMTKGGIADAKATDASRGKVVDLDQMTVDELDRLVADLRRKRSEAAKVIEPTASGG